MRKIRQFLAAALAPLSVTVVAQNPDNRQPEAGYRYQEKEASPPPVGRTPARASGPGTIKEITADQFERIDADDDDRISLREFTNSPLLRDGDGPTTGQSPTVAAPRTDGTVLVKPAPGRNTPAHFRRLDRDRDGYLDSVEIAAYYIDEIED